jgi:DNA-directed RNA polymerase specialized sigma24 family protein
VERLTVDEIARKRSIRLSASGVEKRIHRIREALKVRFSTE